MLFYANDIEQDNSLTDSGVQKRRLRCSNFETNMEITNFENSEGVLAIQEEKTDQLSFILFFSTQSTGRISLKEESDEFIEILPIDSQGA